MPEHKSVHPDDASVPPDRRSVVADVVREKLTDAMTPGHQAEFDPEEAQHAGAFVEDALGEQDAADSSIDLAEAATPAAVGALPAAGRQAR